MFKKMPRRFANHVIRNRAKYTAAVVITAMLVLYGTILNERAADVEAFVSEHGLLDEWHTHLGEMVA